MATTALEKCCNGLTGGPKSHHSPFQEKGLTLIELAIAVAIAALLITWASNSCLPVTERLSATAVQSNTNRLFNLARTTAVFKNRIVTLCPLDAQNKCSSDWGLPVAIFEDTANLRAVSDRGQVIRFIQLATNGVIIPSKSSAHSWRSYFQFNPDGTTRGTMGNLTWCPPSETDTRAIHARVNLGGRLIWSQDRDQDGIVENAGGLPLNCRDLLNEYL